MKTAGWSGVVSDNPAGIIDPRYSEGRTHGLEGDAGDGGWWNLR